MGASLVSWNSKKHNVVSQSSIETEFEPWLTLWEVMWIQKVPFELQIQTSHLLLIFCDNVSAQCLAKHLVLHLGTKCVKIDFYFVRKTWKLIFTL